MIVHHENVRGLSISHDDYSWARDGGALGNPEMRQLEIRTSRRGGVADGQSMPRGIITNIFNSLQFDLKRNRLTN